MPIHWRAHLRTTRSRLAWIALLGLLLYGILWALPSIIRVDFLRHSVADELRELTNRPISLGHIYIRFLPHPGVTATDFMVLDPLNKKRPVLRAQQVGLSFYLRPLFSGQLRIRRLSFNSPHFFIRRQRNNASDRWGVLALPPMPLSPTGRFAVETVTVRQGQVEWIDDTFPHPLRLVFKAVALRLNLITGVGDVELTDRALGLHSQLLLTYERDSLSPVHLLMKNISPQILGPYFPEALAWLDASVDLDARGYAPAAGVSPNRWTVTLDHWNLRPFPAIEASAQVSLSTSAFQFSLRTHGASPDTDLVVRSPWPSRPVTMHGTLTGLSPEVASLFSFSHWLTRLRGRGQLEGSWRFDPHASLQNWRATGRGFTLAGTNLQLKKALCFQDSSELHVQVEATTPTGSATVEWSRPTHSPTAELDVEVSTVTVLEILQALEISTRAPTPEPPGDVSAHNFLSRGYESLRVQAGHLDGVTVEPGRLELRNLQLSVEGGNLVTTGLFDWTTRPGRWAVQGSYQGWRAETLLGHFLTGPPVVSGAGDAHFKLQSGLGPDWLKGLGGSLPVRMTNGTLFELKNLYRIASLIDLSNYFKLRVPDIAARGIPFSELDGTLIFTNGVMQSNDIFLSAPDMKVTARGSVDWPASRIDATVDFQLLRFVEDILRNVPGLRWIFRNGKKIILPLPVKLSGPLDHIDIN